MRAGLASHDSEVVTPFDQRLTRDFAERLLELGLVSSG